MLYSTVPLLPRLLVNTLTGVSNLLCLGQSEGREALVMLT